MGKKKLELILGTLLFGAVSLSAQQLQGDWNGCLEVGANKLPLVLHITMEEGKPVCTLDSPNQGAKGIPATLKHLSEDSVSFHIPAIGAAYQGKWDAGQIKGTFTQMGMSFPLKLHPGEVAWERPQTPKAPFPYRTEEVRFINEGDSAALSGTLTFPVDYCSDEPVPVVLMVTGSGLQNRDEEIMGHHPFCVIADHLAKMGIASLRYDDRGFGQSTGNLKGTTTRTFMKDALAGIHFLKSRPEFDRVGMLGHSEGGTIAFMTAGENPSLLDFIISLAGPTVSGKEVLLEQNRLLLNQNVATSAFADGYCRVLEKVLNLRGQQSPIADSRAVVDQFLRDCRIVLPEALRKNLVQVLEKPDAWLDFFIGYDPTDDIGKISCPVMAVNGEKDTQVAAHMNMEALKATLSPMREHLLKVYPALNHLFQHCETGSLMEYGQLSETISPEVLEDMGTWINSLK